MSFLKYLWLCLTSQRGEGEEEGQGGQGEGSAEGEQGQQGDAEASAGEGQPSGQGQSGEGQRADTVAELTGKFNKLNEQYETLKGQSGATERNLAAERKALESTGMRIVRDADGNVQLMPVQKQGGQSRFSDEHKNKFFTYFPDAQSGQNYLDLMNIWAEDFFDKKISGYDKNLTQRQQFQTVQSQSNQRMIDLFPSLDSDNKQDFNQTFYDKATVIWEASYKNFPNGELIAANEAAIELGIAPSAVAAAKKAGYQQGKTSRQIVGTTQGSQAQSSSSGFKRLEFSEYSKLTPQQKEKYDKDEVESRRKG